jgi:hypothetical protein
MSELYGKNKKNKKPEGGIMQNENKNRSTKPKLTDKAPAKQSTRGDDVRPIVENG